jgi:hypothetical protein
MIEMVCQSYETPDDERLESDGDAVEDSSFDYSGSLGHRAVLGHGCGCCLLRLWRALTHGCLLAHSCPQSIINWPAGGFRVLVLRQGPTIVSAATIRFFGAKFAELPFVATRDGYRRAGNCKRLMRVRRAWRLLAWGAEPRPAGGSSRGCE